jgi:hypothetical protein
MPTLIDRKIGDKFFIRICNQCDPSTYPRGKPILPTDIGAKKDEKGNWVCSECQTEDLNRMFLRTLGPQHPDAQAFIKAEDSTIRKHNNTAKTLNEKLGGYYMTYKKNRK